MFVVNHKVTLCQDHHPRPPRPRKIEAELRASSLAGFDWLKTPSPLSTHSLRTPRAATGSQPAVVTILASDWPASPKTGL